MVEKELTIINRSIRVELMDPEKAVNTKNQPDYYTVEALVGKAIHKRTGQEVYLVKWYKYPTSENTWEPRDNLIEDGFIDAIDVFDYKVQMLIETKKQAKLEEKAKRKQRLEQRSAGSFRNHSPSKQANKPAYTPQVQKLIGKRRASQRKPPPVDLVSSSESDAEDFVFQYYAEPRLSDEFLKLCPDAKDFSTKDLSYSLVDIISTAKHNADPRLQTSFWKKADKLIFVVEVTASDRRKTLIYVTERELKHLAPEVHTSLLERAQEFRMNCG